MEPMFAVAQHSEEMTPRRCKSRSALTIFLGMAAAFILLASPQLHAQKIGFLWNNNPTTPGTTTPSTSYSYNSSGGAISVTRNSKGYYTVDFYGLGDGLYSDVQVNGYGSGSDYCNVGGWGSSNYVDVRVGVYCYTKGGAMADHSFTLLYQARTSSDATKPDVAFVWASQPTASSYAADSYYSYNVTGGQNIIGRSSKGNYEVYLPGLTTVGGTVMVGAYGSSNHCQVSDWGSNSSGTYVYVNCTNVHGKYADSYFDLVYSIGQTAGYSAGSDAGGAIWAYNDTDTSYYDVSSTYSIAIDGEQMYAESYGKGKYVWAMNVLPEWTSSTVVATAYGAPGNYCTTDEWYSNSTYTYVYVDCFNSKGQPTDSRFTATFQLAGVY